MSQVTSAWDALQRSKASIRIKEVEPVMERINNSILEASDKGATFVSIKKITDDCSPAAAVMISNQLQELGYYYEPVDGVISWEQAE